MGTAFQKVTFRGATGARLAGRLDLPADGTPHAYALFAHCFTCSKDLKAVGHISRELNRHHIAVLRFDFTGLGESEGDFADTNFSSNVDDLVAAGDFLAAEYRPPEILIGHSLGGAAVLQAASRLPTVRAVVTIAAPHDPRHVEHLLADAEEEIRARGEATVRLAGRGFTVKRQLLDDLERTRVDEAVATLGRALLVFHSPVDQIVGIENAARIYQAAKHPKSFVSLDDADHLLTREPDAIYLAHVLAAWLTRYVETPAHRSPPDIRLQNRVVARLGAEGFKTDIMAGGHGLVADEPLSVGGTDLGPTPYDLLAAALGACTAMTIRMYAGRKGWDLEGVEVGLTHSRVYSEDEEQCETRPVRIDQLERDIRIEGQLDDEQRRRILEIADRCPVHRTLSTGVAIVTTPLDDRGAAGA